MKAPWMHRERYGDRPYIGTYMIIRGKRTFRLSGLDEKNEVHTMDYESHFQAKRNGWTRG